MTLTAAVMDYTTVATVKAALNIQTGGDDTLIQRYVTAASRMTDTICAKSQTPEATDYFARATVTNQVLRGIVDKDGSLICYPRKSNLVSVSAISWRLNPLHSWQDVDASRLEIAGRNEIKAWAALRPDVRGEVTVRVSFVGGLADTYAGLPADFVELVTLLAVRLYREGEGGVTDTIGIAELGTSVYTRALPQRFKEMIRPYQRTVRW